MTAALDVPGATLHCRDLLALREVALSGRQSWEPCQTMLVADFRPSMLRGLIRAFRSVAAAEALVLVGWRVAEAGGQVGAEPVAVSWGWHPGAPRSGQHVPIGHGGLAARKLRGPTA